MLPISKGAAGVAGTSITSATNCRRSREALGAIHRASFDGRLSAELVVAGDVTDPLRGAAGAAAVHGLQKGASVADIDALENGYDDLIVALTRSGWADAAAV